MAHARHSRPDSGLDVKVKLLEVFQVVLSWLGRESAVRRERENVAKARRLLSVVSELCMPSRRIKSSFSGP